jgi:ribosomal protein S17
MEGIGAVTKETYMKDQKVGTHYLKGHPAYYMLVKMDKKSFEIRKNDRDFRVGDKIVLCEWDPSLAHDRPAEGYTGSTRTGVVVSMVPSGNGISGPADEAIVPGYVVLGMRWEG